MATAKLFKHGGSQAVRLPKAFRFSGSEILVEKRGDEVILRAKAPEKLKTLADVARFMAKLHPEGANFPDRAAPKEQQKRDLTW
jgi:antitoxin VapB